MKNNIPVLADIAGVLLYMLLLPWLVSQFKTHSVRNGIVIMVFYVIFCISVYLLRISVTVNSPDSLPSAGILLFWSCLFAVMVFYMIIDFTGVLSFITETSLTGQNEIMQGTRGTVMVTGFIALFFFVLMLYPVTMLVKTRPLWSSGSIADALLQTMALSGINLMIIVSMAHWEVALKSESPYTGLGAGGKILIFAACYLFFLLFYGAPRAMFYKANPSLWAVGSFFAQTGFYLWRFLDGSAWK